MKEWFEELSSQRTNYVSMEVAYAPLRITDIESYFRVKRISYQVVEVDMLLIMDKVFLSIINRKDKDE